MTHQEFVAAYHDGALRVYVDPAGAAKLVSARLLLPFVLLPVLGLGVALALVGHWVWGGAVFLAGIALRFLVRASSCGFVLSRALGDARFYEEALRAGLLRIEPPDAE